MSNRTRLSRRVSTDEENTLRAARQEAYRNSTHFRNNAVHLHNALSVLIENDMDAGVVRETLTARMNEFFEKSEAEHLRGNALHEEYTVLRKRNDAIEAAESK